MCYISVSELPAEVLERILLSLHPAEILKMKEVSHLFLDLISSSNYLQHRIDLYSAGLVDNPHVVCSLAKRRSLLREYVDGWKNAETPVQYDFTLKSRIGALNSLPPSQNLSSAFSEDWMSISFVRIPSSPGREAVKEWTVELPFRSVQYVVWSQGNLLAVVERGIRFFNIHLLSLLDGSPHEIPLKSVLPLDLGHYRNPIATEMQISGSRIALVIQVSGFPPGKSRRLIVWDWKTGEVVLEHSSGDPVIGDAIDNITAMYFLEDSWLLSLLYSPVARLLVFNTLLPRQDPRSWRILDLPSYPPGRDGYSISTQYEKPLTELPEFSVDPDQRFFAVFPSRGLAFVIPVGLLIRCMHTVRTWIPWDEWGTDVVIINLCSYTRSLQIFDTKVLILRSLGVEMFDLSASCRRDIQVQPVGEGEGRRCMRVLSTPKWIFEYRTEDETSHTMRLAGDSVIDYFEPPSSSGRMYVLRIRKLGQI